MSIGNPADGAHQFAVWRREIERRLRDLEVGRRAPSTVQAGGTFELRDDDGDPVFLFGQFDRSGGTAFGVQAVVPDGAGPGTTPTVFEVDDDGLEAPYLELPTQPAGEFIAVTSGSFVDVWEARASLLVAAALFVDVPWATDPATTGEVRVSLNASTTDPVTLGAGTSGNAELRWLHGQHIGSGPYLVKVQARRTGGAGNVSLFVPTVAQAGNDGTGATNTGT